MINEHAVSELLYCNNENLQNGCVIEIALWNEEEKPGFPAVIASIHGVEIQITLQDVPEIISVFQSFIDRLFPFMDPFSFEKNKIVLRKTSEQSMVPLFERYHECMKKTE